MQSIYCVRGIRMTKKLRDLDDMGEGKGKAILLAAVDYSQTIRTLQVPETGENEPQLS